MSKQTWIKPKKNVKSTFLKDPLDSVLAHAGKVVDRIPDGFIALMAAHPIVVALLLQAGCVLGMSLIGVAAPEHAKNVPNTPYWHLYNLSASAQGIAIASATVPIVTGGLNILSSALQRMGPRE